jgi:AhpD family alkylhydroperoxidase
MLLSGGGAPAGISPGIALARGSGSRRSTRGRISVITIRRVSDERQRKFSSWPEGYQSIIGLSKAVARSGLEADLLGLVKMRASQINGCAYCLDMHSKDARVGGETEQRLYALSAWRETPFFSERERAALALTEAVTLIAESRAPLQVIQEAATVFSPDELSKLVYAIIEINSWNRLAITTGAFEPGSYQPGERRS